MKNLVAGLALASLLAGTIAVDPNGDPTDLNNYPPCAVGDLVRKGRHLACMLIKVQATMHSRNFWPPIQLRESLQPNLPLRHCRCC